MTKDGIITDTRKNKEALESTANNYKLTKWRT